MSDAEKLEILKAIREVENNINEKIDKKFKDLTDHFNKKHDDTRKCVTQNQIDIAVLKTKQTVIAAVAGLSGGFAQDLLKKIF